MQHIFYNAIAFQNSYWKKETPNVLLALFTFFINAFFCGNSRLCLQNFNWDLDAKSLAILDMLKQVC